MVNLVLLLCPPFTHSLHFHTPDSSLPLASTDVLVGFGVEFTLLPSPPQSVILAVVISRFNWDLEVLRAANLVAKHAAPGDQEPRKPDAQA